MVTRCVHHFCGQCITKAIDSSSGEYCRCPLCNEKITKRSLRPQLEVSDIIQSFKEAVDSFERDKQMSIMSDSDVVVFDVSDKSSLIQSNDSIEIINESKDQNKSEVKEHNKSIESFNENNDIELNRKMTAQTLTSDELTSGQPLIDIQDMDVTDVYFNSTKSSNNNFEEFEDDIDFENFKDNEPEVIPVMNPNPTQSQDLRVSKSKITYGSSRPPTNDKFDRIIRLSDMTTILNESKSNEKPNEVRLQSEVESELESIETQHKTNSRKPLIQLNGIQNKKTVPKKNYKRIQRIESSDEELSPIKSQSKANQIEESDKSLAKDFAGNKTSKVLNLDLNEKSEDLFLPSIENNSCEVIDSIIDSIIYSIVLILF